MVVNSSLAVDLTIQFPCFDLHQRQWSLLHHFQAGQCHYHQSYFSSPINFSFYIILLLLIFIVILSIYD